MRKRKNGCGRTNRYKGVREPRCQGGDGCWPCWAKFILNNPKWDPLLLDAGACEVTEMKIVFVDVDGVLNNSRPVGKDHTFVLSNWVLPRCMHQLNRIIQATGAKIVVSSTWRIGKRFVELREMFRDAGLVHECIIGVTPAFSSGYRGEEIQDWIRNHDLVYEGDPEHVIECFVILDDDSDLKPYMDRHVHTDLYRGLTRRKADQAIKLLNGDKTA